MTAVALTSLCSTAAVSLMNHNGNVLEAAKDIVAADNVKKLAMTMITAGIVEGIFCGLDMSTVYKAPPGTQAASTTGIEAATGFAKDMETFMGHLGRETIRTAVSSGLSAATGDEVNLGRAAIQTVANAAGKTAAGMAGDGKDAGTMSDLEHMAAHFGTAAVVAAVTNPDDPLKAALVAGTSAVVAHKMAEMLAPDYYRAMKQEE